MNVPEMTIALKAKYPPPQYAILFEVRNKTGYRRGGTQRYADAICMDLYPSKGLYLSGFEFKTSRQDLMNDLRHPDKHLEIAKLCNYWWLAVGDRKIIKEGEIPEAWGLMVPRGDNLIIKKQAPFREIETIPISFVASLLRSALRASPAEQEINAAVDRALKHERSERNRGAGYDVSRLTESRDTLLESIKEFEAASGLKISTFSPFNSEKLGEAVRFVLDGGLNGVSRKLEAVKKQADIISFIAGNSAIHIAEEKEK